MSDPKFISTERKAEASIRESGSPNAVIVSTRDSILANSGFKNINPSMVDSMKLSQ